MADIPAPTTPSPKPARPGRLDSLPRCRREAVRLYSDARAGLVPARDAAQLASVLTLVASLIRDGELVDRLAELEVRVPW